MDDLEQLMDMLDQAMTSDDPRVKDTFRKLMMIVALTNTDAQPKGGPLRQLREELSHLNQRMAALQSELDSLRLQTQRPGTGGYPYTTTGTGTGYPWYPGNVYTTTTTLSNGGTTIPTADM